MVSNKIKVLSLFSGCGGMDLGIEGNFKVLKKSINLRILSKLNISSTDSSIYITLPNTIFSTVFSNDILLSAQAAWNPYFTKRGNNNNTFNLCSIVNLVKKYNEGNTNVFPAADVITGGFPCQDFSLAGKRKGFFSHKSHNGNLLNEFDDPTEENRGRLYYWMRNVIGIVKPKMFIAENVKGLVSLENVREVIERDLSNVGRNGYYVTSRILNAANYGVPQSRERIIFLGFNKDFLKREAIGIFETNSIFKELDPFPLETHSKKIDGQKMPYVTVRDALSGLQEPEESEDVSQQAYSKARWYGKHVQGQTEVNLDGLGPTIRAEHHGNIEFRRLSYEHGGKIVDELEKGLKERRLTVRECARIQTFPDDFEFVRTSDNNLYNISTSDGYKLIGNAVPPLLAYNLAYRFQEIWNDLFIS